MRRNVLSGIALVAVAGLFAVAYWWGSRWEADLPDGDVSNDGAADDRAAAEEALPKELRASVGSGTFRVSLSVELNEPGAGAEVHYTLDNSEPSITSALYSGPIELTSTAELAARSFLDGVATGETLRHSFVRIDRDVSRFRSEIPVLIIETFGAPIQRYRDHSEQGTPYVDTLFQVYEPGDDGVADLSRPASFAGRAGVKARGSSTLGREKSSFSVEIRDSLGEDLDVALLGLPAESDWVLLGPFEYDRALIRNALIYELARQAGRYAPRTRFVEVFLNEDGGPVRGPVPRGADYYGVYVLVEKIKRGTKRVDVESLLPENNNAPEVTGGYIIKVDRAGPGDMGFYSGGREFHYVYPKERNISSEQREWIESYVQEFHAALGSPEFADDQNGYARYLDVESAIDYHIFNEFPKNPDSYVYSAYFHKPRGGKLVAGPVWDFDRTMGCDNDRRAYNPRGWSRHAFRFWYRRLFRDADFRARYTDRWAELRQGSLAYEHITGLIDEMADSIQPAAERNAERWGDWIGLPVGRWRTEIEQLKRWIRERLEWMDEALRLE